jgi:hypothetical protein
MKNANNCVLLISNSTLYGSGYLDHAAMVRVENGSTTLKGSAGARIFRKGMEPVEVQLGAQLDNLLESI